jgi:hypothetical protein
MLVADLNRGTTSEIRLGGGKDANGKPLGRDSRPERSFSAGERQAQELSDYLAAAFDDD